MPIIDEEAAQVVRRIFERRAKGESAYRIALDLQADGISSPAVYAERKFGKKVTGDGHNFGHPRLSEVYCRSNFTSEIWFSRE